MLLCGCQRGERSEARRFLAFLDRKVFAQAARNRELPIYDREHSAEEKEIPGLRRLDVCPQRCWGCRQDDSELAKARTRTACDSFIYGHDGRFLSVTSGQN